MKSCHHTRQCHPIVDVHQLVVEDGMCTNLLLKLLDVVVLVHHIVEVQRPVAASYKAVPEVLVALP